MEKKTYILPLVNVNSAHCAMRVRNAIDVIAGIDGVEVDHDHHEARLSITGSAQLRDAVNAIRNVGYNVATEVLTFSTTGVTCAGCAIAWAAF
jgi:Cu2+-exporting ATPase